MKRFNMMILPRRVIGAREEKMMLQDGAVMKHSHVFNIYASLQLLSNMKAFLLIFAMLCIQLAKKIGYKCTKSRFQKKIEVAEIE